MKWALRARLRARVWPSVFSRRRTGSVGGLAGSGTGETPVPRWLTALHNFVSLVVFLAICLAVIILVATLVRAGYSWYEHTVHATHELSASVTGLCGRVAGR
jgi:hypothetical protein